VSPRVRPRFSNTSPGCKAGTDPCAHAFTIPLLSPWPSHTDACALPPSALPPRSPLSSPSHPLPVAEWSSAHALCRARPSCPRQHRFACTHPPLASITLPLPSLSTPPLFSLSPHPPPLGIATCVSAGSPPTPSAKKKTASLLVRAGGARASERHQLLARRIKKHIY